MVRSVFLYGLLAMSQPRRSRSRLHPQSLRSWSKPGVIVASALALAGLPLLVPAARATFEDSPKATLDQAWQIVNENYVDPSFNNVDWKEVRHELLSQDYSSPEAAYDALRKALAELDDPYTRFMDPKEFQAFTDQTNGELVGVGIQLGINQDTNVLTVIKPIEGSPAIAAGIQAGDQILAVDGASTQDMTVDAAANLIRGEAGTPVELTLKRDQGDPFPVTITRAQIDVPVVYSSIKDEHDQHIGYIRLSEFNAHSGDQMEQAIKTLEPKVDGYVLDLRNNPGGMLHQSIAIAQMFLNQGDIVKTVDRYGNSEEATADGTAITTKPLVILVNGNSASASEILSGALQDNHRATLVGSQTFGKALVQSVTTLKDGSGLNVTIAHYYTPSGADINHRGISPDLEVNTNERDLWSHPDRVATNQDSQYVAAVDQLSQSIAATATHLESALPSRSD